MKFILSVFVFLSIPFAVFGQYECCYLEDADCGDKGVDAVYCACFCDVHPDDEDCIVTTLTEETTFTEGETTTSINGDEWTTTSINGDEWTTTSSNGDEWTTPYTDTSSPEYTGTDTNVSTPYTDTSSPEYTGTDTNVSTPESTTSDSESVPVGTDTVSSPEYTGTDTNVSTPESTTSDSESVPVGTCQHRNQRHPIRSRHRLEQIRYHHQI